MPAQSDTKRQSRIGGWWRWLSRCLPRRTGAAAVAASLLVLAGCGGEDPVETVRSLTAAIADGDAEAVCALISEQYLAAEGGCEKATRFTADEREHAARIVGFRSVDVPVSNAAVVEGLFAGSERQEAEIVLVEEGGEWKACRIDVGSGQRPFDTKQADICGF